MNELFMMCLDPILERSSAAQMSRLRMICKRGKDKIDSVLREGIDQKKSQHVFTTSSHNYKMTASFNNRTFVIYWKCMPWCSDMAMYVFVTLPHVKFIERTISLWFNDDNDMENYDSEPSHFAMMLLRMAFPHFQPTYATNMQQCGFPKS